MKEGKGMNSPAGVGASSDGSLRRAKTARRGRSTSEMTEAARSSPVRAPGARDSAAGPGPTVAGPRLPAEGRGAVRRSAWALTGLLTLVAAVSGVAFPSLYSGLVQVPYLPGAYSQDAISIAEALVLLWLAVNATPAHPKLELIALGVLGYLAYVYGIYVIERVYNGLYLVYMAVFALSFWSVVYEALALARRTPHV